MTNLIIIIKKYLRRRSDPAIKSRVNNFFEILKTNKQEFHQSYWKQLTDLYQILSAEGMTNPDECLLLRNLSQQVRKGCIVEIGSYRGRSTIALAQGVQIANSQIPIYAVDPHEKFVGVMGGTFGPQDRIAFFKNLLKTNTVQEVRLINLPSEVIIKGWQKNISLLWIDGDHSYEGVKKDFDLWKPFLMPKAMIVFDDSNNPKIGPYQLIQELVQSNQYKIEKIVGKVTVLK